MGFQGISWLALPMQEIRIVRAKIQDAARIAPLFDLYRQFYGQHSNLERVQAFLLDRLLKQDSTIFLALKGEGIEVLGFTQLYPSYSSVSMRPIWILNDLYVAESFRKHGIARRLVEAAVKLGKETGAKRLSLSTARTNLAAQALYERLGWIQEQDYLHYELEF